MNSVPNNKVIYFLVNLIVHTVLIYVNLIMYMLVYVNKINQEFKDFHLNSEEVSV